jgi:predicted O-methyltransferase YrrM
MTSVLNDPKLEKLVARLHRQSNAQLKTMDKYFAEFARKTKPADRPGAAKKFLSDKLVALEPDKAQFCYQLCRALNVRRIVEAGTSYGVSTLYLAAAARDNAREHGGNAVVIGTEYEPAKAKAARANFAKAGLSKFIDLREGDLRETLKDIGGPVDFVLIDIWVEMARPALECVAPHLHPGSIVVADNTSTPTYNDGYKDYFKCIADPANRLRTMTLPFSGGFELTVRV